MANAWYHWHVIFYWHFATAANGKGVKVSVLTHGDTPPAPAAFEALKAAVPNANLLVDTSRTVCTEQARGKHKPKEMPDAFIIGKVPMDNAYSGSDGPASWSKRNAYLPIEPTVRKARKNNA